MNTRTSKILLTLLGTLAGLHAQAGRPLVTEDAGVLEPGACEVESFASRQREPSSPRVSGVSLQLGCGVGMQSQVALAGARERSEGETSRAWTFSGKTALNEPADDGPAYTLAWGAASLRQPGGSHRHEDSFLNGVMSMPWGEALTLHANLGWSRSESARQSTTGWALALEHATTPAVSLMTEAFATDRDHAPWVQLAARWTLVPEKLFLDGSWGLQTTGQRPKMVTLGLKASF